MTKAHAKITAELLSDAARSLLLKKYRGQSHMGKMCVWHELDGLGLTVWNAEMERTDLTANGEKVAAVLAEGA